MNLLENLANNFLLLLNAMSIYILIGLFVAGILKQIVPENFIQKHLGKGKFTSVIKATILGIPLPVCSCSVIPLAQALRKEGASKGAVQSFLISTPITGVDSILATYSFFGLVFTIYRIISSIIIAIFVGLFQNFLQSDDNNAFKNKQDECSCSCSCTSDSFDKKKFSIKEVFKYAYITLFKDMVKPLFLGLILGAIFTTFSPKEYTSLLFENEILTYLIVMIFAIPLYICATASLPLAAAFVLLGMSGGAAFIFLTAGPATSTVTMSVVYKMLGKKSLLIYISTIMFFSFVFAYIFDNFFTSLIILNVEKFNEEYSLVSQISSMIMLLLMGYYLINSWLNRKVKSCCNENSSCNEKKDKISNNFTVQKPKEKTEFRVKL